MDHRLEHLRPPAQQPRRTGARPSRTSIGARPRTTRGPVSRKASPPCAVSSSEDRPLRDRGISLLAVFTAATLVIVALVCLVGGVDRWWILIPVMVIHLAVTAIVLAITIRLLDDGSAT